MQSSHVLNTRIERSATTGAKASGANLGIYAPCKRLLDLGIASATLILAAPVMMLIALLVKLNSPGPALFKQVRLGRGGRPFTFYKFRTMRQDADATVHVRYVQSLIHGEAQQAHPPDDPHETQALYKLSNDSRITTIGRVLRRTSLDELPQLLNVLKGDMSLVGPRPPLPYEVEVYEPRHMRRLDAVPGITGWWQVRGRSRVTFDEMVQMDIEYIENCSFLLDLRILIATIPAVLAGSGAR